MNQQLTLIDLPSTKQPIKKRGSKLDRRAEELCDKLLSQCDEAGLNEADRRRLLLRFHLRAELEFLANFTQNERRQYVAQLLEVVFKEDT